jgi:predicted nucleic acid-binding protein
VRALLERPELLRRLRGALAPELVLAEVANALLGYVRADRLSAADASTALADARANELELCSLADLIEPAFEIAHLLGTSAYDACYLALAEQQDAVLVTADQRLAGLAARAELVS